MLNTGLVEVNMIDAEETKRFKAKNLRYKNPIVKNLNLVSITQELWDIQEECESSSENESSKSTENVKMPLEEMLEENKTA